MRYLQIEKIVSGGQTGVDQAALDVAIFLDIEHGGWCPRDRRSESGRIPAQYRLKETTSRDYSLRTEKNVIDSDGTLLLFRNRTTGGTELTRRLALKHRRPLLCLDLEVEDQENYQRLSDWLSTPCIKTINIAGPRESTCQGIAQQVEQFLVNAFRFVNSPR